jgi:phospholipid/cholesterol/gamma-HCH transport system substrate-binding protein
MVLALLSAVILGASGYVANLLIYPAHQRVINLDHIGSLQRDDPIRLRGAQIGHISAIVSRDDRVLVTVNLAEPVEIHRNYQVSVAEKGILGERFLVLEPGDDSAPLLGERDTLTATFAPGIAEVMGQAWKLEPAIKTLAGQVDALRFGSNGKPSLVSQMQAAFTALDSFSLRLQSASQILSTELGGQLVRIDSMITTTDRTLGSVSAATPELVQNLQKTLQQLTGTVASLEQAIDQINTVARQLNDPKNLLWSDQLFRLQEELQAIKRIINELNESALRLKLRISFTR